MKRKNTLYQENPDDDVFQFFSMDVQMNIIILFNVYLVWI